ncbi:PrsW family glutamic-type intramembrane protease [Thermoleptolyngbya sp. PKUAC-SCTB121]|uniref:PrsW family glutamic-type intramembrane protease n=1 Tax=Thermoleptolyngbya sp. PKUAC-SCTB121 TaxID=2811482 RepID=UPI001CECC286|nr:PrsW family glutamic-type intramembrane protease [Thermoleptolyngbya sp. PKUAC-SCTB121]
MTDFVPQVAYLRLCAPTDAAQADVAYPLPLTREVRLGRDPDCQIVVDSAAYSGVSRFHACIEATPDRVGWQLRDLESTNGTYLNGRLLHQAERLRAGDRLSLGQRGPQFVFELRPVQSADDASIPDARLIPTVSSDLQAEADVPDPPEDAGFADEGITVSQLFPILSTGTDLLQRAYLVPGIITVSFVVLLFIAVGNPPVFNVTLATYLAIAAYYVVYQLCGKPKPLWWLLGAALMMVVLLLSPVLNLFIYVFQDLLPGDIPARFSGNLLVLLGQMFIGAGLMEELLKAIPVLVACAVGLALRSPWRERLGVWEPLDGILLGTASAVGFTLLETLGQYVPSVIQNVNMQGGIGLGEVSGLQILIARVLGSIAGHIAYSGYLGYFIGLSMLKPAHRWRTLGTGYLTASVLHALWNVCGILNLSALAIVGSVSYAFLMAAILKARKLSPTRRENFATQLRRRG